VIRDVYTIVIDEPVLRGPPRHGVAL